MTHDVAMTVNGRPVRAAVEARTLLVELLRERLGLTGAHVGCETTQCGCCVVHVDGLAVKSCTMLALQAEGAAVTTLEGWPPPARRCIPCRRRFASAMACNAATAPRAW